jgi:PPOX class probable F420-dependent enzyme
LRDHGVVAALLDPDRADDVHTSGRLATEPVIWLGTTRPDGRPHHVPVWFLWSDPLVLVFSMPGTQKLRNMGHMAAVTLTLDSADSGRDIVILEGRASLADDTTPPMPSMLPAFEEKYSALTSVPGFDAWRSTFSEPIMVAVSRVVAWTRKNGELFYRSVP